MQTSTAVLVSSAWGLSVLALLSLAIAHKQNQNPWIVVAEHMAIALVVIGATHYVGKWISVTFS